MRAAGGFRNRSLAKTLDWWLIGCWILLVCIGLINIYASIHSTEPSSVFSWECRSGKQFIWILTAIGIALTLLFLIPARAYEGLSLPIYIGVILLLISVIFLGIEVKGSRSWFEFGPIRFQPAEISKISTSLLLATVMSQLGYKIGRAKDFIFTALIILVPMAIIVLQSETGSALVYVGFIFMLYREGLSGWLIFLVGMAILLFILTMTMSPYVAILTLAGVTSFCICLYSRRFKWWIIICLPLLILLCFFPKIFTAVEAISSFNPIWILLGCTLLSMPFVALKAFRERNTFTHLALISFLAGLILVFSADFIFNFFLDRRTNILLLPT